MFDQGGEGNLFVLQFCLFLPTISFESSSSEVFYFTKVGVDPGGPVVIILSSGSEVRGFDPGWGQWIFQTVKILSMTSFGREIKPWVPCRRFTARGK